MKRAGGLRTGRRHGESTFHPALPWVLEFQADRLEAEVWRDLGRTKFRLNKGDEQLDLTYDSAMPHHVTDILTDITCYVYLARRTPVSVRRAHLPPSSQARSNRTPKQPATRPLFRPNSD